MKIGVDSYPLSRNVKAGIGNYTDSLLYHMSILNPHHNFYLYNSGGVFINYHEKLFSNHSQSGIFNRSSTLWMMFLANHQLQLDGIDVFWGTQGLLPLNLPRQIKTILTIHDLTIVLFPRTMAFINFIVNLLLFKKSIQKADRIIAISETTANAIVKYIGGEVEKKITVIYNGVSGKRFDTYYHEENNKKNLQLSGIKPPFILFVGTIEPRKNLSVLLKAFQILKIEKNIPHQLVIAGAAGWKLSSFTNSQKQLNLTEGDLKILGYVSEYELQYLYSNASLFIMPSLYEGFGMPPLEAMHFGVPVIASNIPIFREILGNSAKYFSPHDFNELSSIIYTLLTNDRLLKDMQLKGKEQSKRYSWQQAAKETLAIFNSFSS
jgi:glycosyltransferase involved in cell wall biosynthesis